MSEKKPKFQRGDVAIMTLWLEMPIVELIGPTNNSGDGWWEYRYSDGKLGIANAHESNFILLESAESQALRMIEDARGCRLGLTDEDVYQIHLALSAAGL